MNVKSQRTKPLNWKRIAIFAIVIGIAGYKWYGENFGKNNGGAAVADRDESSSSDNDYTVNFPENGTKSDSTKSNEFEPILKGSSKKNNAFEPIKQNSQKKNTQNSSSQFEPIKKNGSNTKSNNSSGSYLTSAGGKNKKSPAGLIYGMGGGGEHRTDHVLRHAEDQPNRPGTHSVFDADGDDVFRLIDEAYELIKQKSKQVKSEESRGNMAHIIDMKRKIGFKGGQTGKRSGHKPLKKIKLILAGGNRVITAFPY